MTEPEKSLEPGKVASARRRFGFVALLWWIAAGSGTLGVVQGFSAGLARWFFIVAAWVFAIFFSYAWWQLRKGLAE
jgi:hypothetical protein